MKSFIDGLLYFIVVLCLTMVIGGICSMIYLSGANMGAKKAMDEAISLHLAQHNPKTGAYEWLIPATQSATNAQAEKPLDK
jgi:hypothetical protein